MRKEADVDDDTPDGISIDLWDALHDSFLRRVGSNAVCDSAFVAVESLHLNDFHNFAVGSEFEIRFGGVQALEVIVARQHAELVGKEFTHRIESASWSDFEGAFKDDRGDSDTGTFENGRYELLQARLDVCEGCLTFTIDEIVDHDRFEASSNDLLRTIRILAASVEILGPDGRVHTVESFNALGTAYWENWRQKRQSAHS
jgi:hypothetical protein